MVGLALLAALGRRLRADPPAFPIAVVAALPFRIPIAVGGSTSNLLVPLYLVVAAGALAWACARRAGRASLGPATPDPPAGGRPRGWSGSSPRLVLYAVQAAYSTTTARALEQVVFFYVPFALLFVLLARLGGRARWRRCLGVLTGLAVVFAGIGFVEYATRQLLLNPKVIASNQFESYFRVNSLFFDPNIYGRFLAVVMICSSPWMLWRAAHRATSPVGAVVVAVLWGGLVLTFSQSSFAALLVGLAVLGALRWNPRRALALAAGGRGDRGGCS